jgi:hypothetical protein
VTEGNLAELRERLVAMRSEPVSKGPSSIIDSQGPLSETEKSRSALAAATAQFAP